MNRVRTYCAIIGDMNDSRSLKNRAQVQRRFEAAIGKLNEEYRKELAAEFMITLGDEFQGLLVSAGKSHAIVMRFRELMAPVAFSFGIGIGTLSTRKHRQTVAMDGEVFHAARRAVERSKKSRMLVTFAVNDRAETVLNSLTELAMNLRGTMTGRQSEIASLIRRLGTQSRVARALGIRQPTVWKSLASARASAVHRAEDAISSYLETLISRPRKRGAAGGHRPREESRRRFP